LQAKVHAGWVTKRHDGTAAITSRAIAESGVAIAQRWNY
jgi:hypothetical protein